MAVQTGGLPFHEAGPPNPRLATHVQPVRQPTMPEPGYDDRRSRIRLPRISPTARAQGMAAQAYDSGGIGVTGPTATTSGGQGILTPGSSGPATDNTGVPTGFGGGGGGGGGTSSTAGTNPTAPPPTATTSGGIGSIGETSSVPSGSGHPGVFIE